MAMILDAFVGTVTKELAKLVEEEVVMTLGVKDDLKKLQRRLERIQPVLQAAERRRIGNESINNWVKEMKDIMYDADDIIDLCRIEAAGLLDDQPSPSVRCHFPLISCFTSAQLRHKLGKKIKSLNDRLNEITTDNYLFSNQFHLERTEPHLQVSGVNPRETSPVMVESDIVGREIQVATNSLVESLVREGSQTCCDIFAVVGMGGIGKTTLAQKIFNDRRIQSKFPIKVWVCVSKEFQETKLLREIIRQVGGDPRGAETKAELLPLLRDVVSGKSFFLVLDDVWSANVWVDLLRYSLQSGATTDSCRVLVTARDANVATTMGAGHTHGVQLLQLESGWELLSKSVFKNGVEEGTSLKDIGVQIVQKCRGLPLAIKVVAGLLSGKTRREWEDVVRNELWSLSALPEELRGALYLSYEDLPSHLKQCFLYLALFPEDYVYDRWDLVRMWVAEGFVERRGNKLMEDVAEDYYNELIRRNLLQSIPGYDFAKDRCTLHDLLRSLAQHLSREESFYGDPQELSTATTSIKLRRLSVPDNGEVAAIPESIMKQEGLRTLLLITSPPRFENALFARLSYLRVLLLNEEAIESIPDSLGELVHLRLLDLDRTSISILPESIGRLTNLEMLNLQGCKSLHTLPKGVTRLCNLRRLGLWETPLSFLPKGIGRLEKLNDLQGFFVGADSTVKGHQEHGCSLEELSPLSQLRELLIRKLERAQIRAGASSPLMNKPYFRRLWLFCTPQTSREGGTTPHTEEDVNRIETLFGALQYPFAEEMLAGT